MGLKQSLNFQITGLLQICIGLGAIPAGVGFIIDPYGGNLRIPYELIFGSPFDTYLIPGICLLTVNGFGSLLGAALSITKHGLAGFMAIFLGAALLIWMFCQIYWIGVMNWLQPLYVVLGFVELVLGFSLVLSMKGGWKWIRISKKLVK